jgi:hypothetical protein
MQNEVIETGRRTGNGRYAKNEIVRLLEDYRASGVSQKRWCARNGVKVATLGYWLRRERERQEGYELVTVEPQRHLGAEREVEGAHPGRGAFAAGRRGRGGFAGAVDP